MNNPKKISEFKFNEPKKIEFCFTKQQNIDIDNNLKIWKNINWNRKSYNKDG